MKSLSTASLTRAARTLPEWAIAYWPGGVGRLLRSVYWKTRLGAMGERCHIDVGVVISCPELVFLGDDVWIDNYVMISAGRPIEGHRATKALQNPTYAGSAGEVHIGSRSHVAPYALIQGHGGVSIGSDVTVGAHVALYSYSHHYKYPLDGPRSTPDDYHSVPKYSGLSPMSEQSMLIGAVTLADATAVLANSVVLPGTSVGRYTIVGAASLVSGEVPPAVIASGNPLVVRRQRFEEDGAEVR